MRNFFTYSNKRNATRPKTHSEIAYFVEELGPELNGPMSGECGATRFFFVEGILLIETPENLLTSEGAVCGRLLSVMSTPFDHVRRRCVSAAVIVF